MALRPTEQEAEELARMEKLAAEKEAKRKAEFIDGWAFSSPEEQGKILWHIFICLEKVEQITNRLKNMSALY